jgi:hypothetical protein
MRVRNRANEHDHDVFQTTQMDHGLVLNLTSTEPRGNTHGVTNDFETKLV